MDHSQFGDIMKTSHNKDLCKGFYVDVCFHFPSVLRSGITESYGKDTFNFIRNYQTVFKVTLPYYIFHQQYMRATVALYPL